MQGSEQTVFRYTFTTFFLFPSKAKLSSRWPNDTIRVLQKCRVLTFLSVALFSFKWLHLMMGRGGGAHAWSLTPSHLLCRSGLCSRSSLSTYSSLYLTLAGICDGPGILSCTLTPRILVNSAFTPAHLNLSKEKPFISKHCDK